MVVGGVCVCGLRVCDGVLSVCVCVCTHVCGGPGRLWGKCRLVCRRSQEACSPRAWGGVLGLAAPWLPARANFEPPAPVLVSGTP